MRNFVFFLDDLRKSSDPFKTVHQTPCDVPFNFASIFDGIKNRIQIRIEIIDATTVIQTTFVAHTILRNNHWRIVVFFVNPHEQFIHSKWHRLYWKWIIELVIRALLNSKCWHFNGESFCSIETGFPFELLTVKWKQNKELFSDTYTKPHRTRSRPVFILWFNDAHIM